jgi:hypothetical protein
VHLQLSFDCEGGGGIRGGGYAELGNTCEEFIITGCQDPTSGEWTMQRRFLHVDSTVQYRLVQYRLINI